MLTTNLSTRPFYNERAVHLTLAAAAVLIGAVTFFNATSAYSLSARQRELAARAERDARRAAALDDQAAAARRDINPREVQTVAAAAEEANALIDRRTFSWTELFNRIETTLPPEVMITSVRPDVRDGRVSVSIAIIGREVEHIGAFMERLEATGAFRELLSRQEEANEDGTYRAVLRGQYVAAAASGDKTPTGTR